MKYLFVQKTKSDVSPKQMTEFLNCVFKSLGTKVPATRKLLVVAFISTAQMRALNKSHRRKDRPTDILSFAGIEADVLGELVLCSQVLKSQAKKHGHTLLEETCYMLVHGVLHLLGYEHEKDDKAATRMYRLQDRIFNSYFRSQSPCLSKPNLRKSKRSSKSARKR